MAKQFQFDEYHDRGSEQGKAPHCIRCEEMLADALDGSLSEADQAWFDGHVSTCAGCSEALADAQRGAAWLEMLRTPRPEPPARLMARILAETSGSPAAEPGRESLQQPQMVPAVLPAVLPWGVPGNLLGSPVRKGAAPAWWRGGMFEPRLAMTAAMAFFSIALTLNLTGVQLNRLHVRDLSATNLKRSYYTANADATRYYDNLRVVRVLESRVEDLRQAVNDGAVPPREEPKAQPLEKPQTAPEAPAGKPEDKKKPAVEPGVSRRAIPMSRPGVLTAEEEVFAPGKRVTSVRELHGAGGLG